MALLQIGRFGADFDVEVVRWDEAGDLVNVSGDFTEDSVALAKAARQQLMGYLDNPDVSVVPLVWSEDDTADGFYTVDRAQVSNVEVSLTGGWFEWSATLRKVPGFAQPLIETTQVGNVRTNDHSVTSADRWTLLPPDYTYFGSADIDINTAQEGADGTAYLVSSAVSAAFTQNYQWRVPPSGFYGNAACLEQSIAGGLWRSVVGRQTSVSATGWRLSNGLARVTPSGSTLEVEVYDSGAGRWDAATAFELQVGGNASGDLPATLTPGTPSQVTVLRNTPERVTVRLVMPFEATIGGTSINLPTVVDLSLRRGTTLLEATVAHAPGVSDDIELRLSSNTGGTSVTGGVAASSVDADGNRYVILSPSSATVDTTNGRVKVALVGSAQFGFGMAEGSHGGWGATALADRYWAAMDETVRVVTR